MFNLPGGLFAAGGDALMQLKVGGKTLGERSGVGNQGEYYKGNLLPGTERGALDAYNKANETANSAQMSDLIQKYGAGDMSMQDAMRGANFGDNVTARNMLTTDPFSGSRFAGEQVQSNPLLSGVFGKDGSAAQTTSAYKNALGSLNAPRTEAEGGLLGQQMGDITRQYGQMDQDLSAQLAARGLGAGSSGAAAAAVGGQLGNKYEQLGRQSLDTAQAMGQQRMNNVMQLGQLQQGMTGQGIGALQDQFGRQMGARQQTEAERAGFAQAEGQFNQSNLQRALGQEDISQSSIASKIAGKNPSFMEQWGRGSGAGVQAQAAAPGKFVSNAAGSAGSAAGKSATAKG